MLRMRGQPLTAIRAAVVSDNDLTIDGVVGQEADRLPDAGRDGLGLIETRHQHRELQVGRLRLVRLSVGHVGHGDRAVISVSSLQRPRVHMDGPCSGANVPMVSASVWHRIHRP